MHGKDNHKSLGITINLEHGAGVEAMADAEAAEAGANVAAVVWQLRLLLVRGVGMG